MNLSLANKATYHSLDFNFKTSSGDNISLSMYDQKEMSHSKINNQNSKIESFSLTHAFGYKFSYRGNGIDENDKKEIAQALKQLQPELEKFNKKVENDTIPSLKELTNKAFEFKNLLPKPKDLNHFNFIADEVLKAFDKNLEKFNPNEHLLKANKSLFDKLLEQMNSFSLYV